MKLSEKQRRFADYYIELGSAEPAALKAGYSKAYARAQAYKLLANVGIKTYIDQKMTELQAAQVADQAEIIRLITGVLRGEVSGTALVGIGKGAQEVEEVLPTVADKLKAAELLGKRYAMWTEKQQIDVAGAVTFVDDIGDGDAT